MGLHLAIYFFLFQSLPSTIFTCLAMHQSKPRYGFPGSPLSFSLLLLPCVNRPKTTPAWDYLLLTTYHAPSIPSGSYLESKFWILSFSPWHSPHCVMPRLHLLCIVAVTANAHALEDPCSIQLTHKRVFRPITMMEKIDFELCLSVEKHVSIGFGFCTCIFTLCPLCTVLIWVFSITTTGSGNTPSPEKEGQLVYGCG